MFLGTIKAFLTSFQTCQVSGRVAGLPNSASLVFYGGNIRCETTVRDGRYNVQLKPGRYVIGYRVFNNFLREICQLAVSQSGEHDIHYETPKMKVRVRNLPAGTQGGMVYLRNPHGGWSAHPVDQLAEFELDFLHEPDQFLEWYNQIGIEVGGSEHTFPFKIQVGGTREIDFSESQLPT